MHMRCDRCACHMYCIYCMESSATCSPAGGLNSSDFPVPKPTLRESNSPTWWNGWVDRDVLWWEPIMNHPQYYHKTTNGQTSSPNGSFILCSFFDHWYNPNSSHDSGPQLPQSPSSGRHQTRLSWGNGWVADSPCLFWNWDPKFNLSGCVRQPCWMMSSRIILSTSFILLHYLYYYIVYHCPLYESLLTNLNDILGFEHSSLRLFESIRQTSGLNMNHRRWGAKRYGHQKGFEKTLLPEISHFPRTVGRYGRMQWSLATANSSLFPPRNEIGEENVTLLRDVMEVPCFVWNRQWCNRQFSGDDILDTVVAFTSKWSNIFQNHVSINHYKFCPSVPSPDFTDFRSSLRVVSFIKWQPI